MFRKLLILLVFSISAVAVTGVYAQGKKHTIYEVPTMKTLSRLYWALLKLDPENDEHIDNFLLINECGLYQEYAQNEFEWNGIRESAREFVMSERVNFPTHFEFLQPLRFAEYNLEDNSFNVWEPYKIDAVRRFEVLAEDIFSDICKRRYGIEIEGYPRGLYVELNRPFTIDNIKVQPEIAQIYIENNQSKIRQMAVPPKNKKELYETREAYLAMKIRIFSYQEEIQVAEYGLSKVLGVLEGYEIYGDIDRELLLFTEDFRRKKQRSQMEVEMKKRYQERLRKQMEEKRKATQGDSNSGNTSPAAAAP